MTVLGPQRTNRRWDPREKARITAESFEAGANTRIVSGEVKNNDLDQLLAWNWKPAVQTPQIDMAA